MPTLKRKALSSGIVNIEPIQQNRLFHNILTHQVLFYLLMGMGLAIPAWGEGKMLDVDVPSYAILLTEDLDKKKPIKIFSCKNRVYLYFTWFLLEGQHDINAVWINPQGKEENQIQLKFRSKEPKTHNWVALEFKNVFDQINALTPSFKAVKLSGKWKVRILLDGHLLETLDFFVHCG